MDKTNQCFACKRFYRGEGHKGYCTSDCWSHHECRKKLGREPRMSKKLHEKRPVPKDSIKVANERWLNKKPPTQADLKRMRMGRAKYEVKCLYEDEVSKRLKVMRG